MSWRGVSSKSSKTSQLIAMYFLSLSMYSPLPWVSDATDAETEQVLRRDLTIDFCQLDVDARAGEGQYDKACALFARQPGMWPKSCRSSQLSHEMLMPCAKPTMHIYMLVFFAPLE